MVPSDTFLAVPIEVAESMPKRPEKGLLSILQIIPLYPFLKTMNLNVIFPYQIILVFNNGLEFVKLFSQLIKIFL